LEGWTGGLDFGLGSAVWADGDLDHDTDVDSVDLLTFLASWTGASAAGSAAGSAGRSDLVGPSDTQAYRVAELLRSVNWRAVDLPSEAAGILAQLEGSAVVPEPSASLLALVLGLAAVRRARQGPFVT
jgi:hypothetical protein